ncbi:MAG: DeoR/GlpR transcriptional regulator [Anaerolineae bacterium]|nr:DeoR/GlpR transcriptional regulator [Anaerolineae bacterium]
MARRAQIVDRVKQKGTVHVSELSEWLGVSEVTIRNDLDVLNEQGLLIRDRGGAIAITHSSLFVDFDRRTQLNLDEKRRIGQAAAQLVQPDETIILDGGTTVMEMAKSLSKDLSLTAITNGLNVASQIGALPNAHVIVLGGSLVPETITTVGPESERDLGNVIAHKLFLATHAIDREHGLADTSIAVARVKRAMVQATRQVILLADSTKWGRVAFAKTIPLSKVHTMISDTGLPEEARNTIQSLGIELILV